MNQRFWKWFWIVVIGVPLAVFAVWAITADPRRFVTTLLNGITLGALYFLVASGFTLVFGLMRNVNLAHGSLYLLGAYMGWIVGDAFGDWNNWYSWLITIPAGFLAAALVGLVLQVGVFRFMQGQELRQTMVTIGISIVLADLMLWWFGGEIYSFDPPKVLHVPLVIGLGQHLQPYKYPTYRLMLLVVSILIGGVLWAFLNRTRIGMMIRAGVDDRNMLAASGFNVQRVFAATFGIGAGMAGMAGVLGATQLSVSPGEDSRYLMVSLIVVIVGGMGSIPGAAVGALLIALGDQFGLAYAPTYGVVFTFLIMVLVLAFRPSGILGRRMA
ncbi:MAG TPA: branched-chain amino acid ABC transporter permease [Magnetospirillaceae bacterium]|jgi:branched-chain amino acid transport system permease protein